MIVHVISHVIVHVAVIVAALGNGNDTVDVFVADRVSNCCDPPVDTARMLHFQRLDVYRCAIEFLALAKKARAQLPRGNADLADQLRRAAQSIPQNIAEGCGRSAPADKARYFAIARGSAMESAAHLDVMRNADFIDEKRYLHGVELLERIVSMLTRLIDPKLDRSKIGDANVEAHVNENVHGVVPVPERGHDHGNVNVDDHVDDHVNHEN